MPRRHQVVVFSSRGQHPDDLDEALRPEYFGYCPQTGSGELDVDYVVHRDSSGNVRVRSVGELHQDRVVIMVLGQFDTGFRGGRRLSAAEAGAIAEIAEYLASHEELDSPEECDWQVDLGPEVPPDQPPPVEEPAAPAQPAPVVNIPENPPEVPGAPPPPVVAQPEPPTVPEEEPQQEPGASPPAPATEGEVPPSTPPSEPSAPAPVPPSLADPSQPAPEPVPADGTQPAPVEEGTPLQPPPAAAPADPNVAPPETSQQP